MKIIKIVVDEMPARCGECPLAIDDGVNSGCAALRDDTTSDASLGYNIYSIPSRHHDCPLAVEETQT